MADGILAVLEPVNGAHEERMQVGADFEMEGSLVRRSFREFFRNFRVNGKFLYSDALVSQYNRREFFVEVDLAHVHEYDEVLFNNLQSRPSELMTHFESGAKDALKTCLSTQSAVNQENNKLPEFQVILKSAQIAHSLRNLAAEHVNKLVKVPGIITSCTKSQAKVTVVNIRCSTCGHTMKLPNNSAMGHTSIPGKCDRGGEGGGEACKPGTYVVMADSCEFIDTQILKLQEAPEVVPTGEMPRSVMLTIERYLVDRVAPGTRVSVMGILSLFNSGTKQAKIQASIPIKTPYLRVVGIQIEADAGGRASSIYTPQEEAEMMSLARDPDIYEKLARSIAPQISSDNTKDIKKALACLLMSGSRKILPDGLRLRGDINVLLMGDPSTAKSQLLKFIERVAPIGIYTSGKGSSAAGLTAAVSKDSKGEFYLEGGAMVLADGGVICIDEFDKMKENDRVAIHEAMEQQTISIAKAGITTVLNSRASFLAAANPIFGRYDDLKGVDENIDLMTTILSRFDCIFIVRDVRDPVKDKSIARHVLSVHINAAMADGAQTAEIDAPTLKKFVGYCRERCAPRLNDAAAALLSDQYVHIRSRVRESLKDRPGESQVVPITIRQLEALVRISESLAKMRLSAEATEADVNEAIRLFKTSTLAASQSNPMLMAAGGAATEEVRRAEDWIKRRMGLRTTVNAKKLMEESQSQGCSDEAVKRAIAAMVMRSELQEMNGKKILKRVK